MATVTNQTELRNAVTALDTEIIFADNITLTSVLNINYTTTFKGEGFSLIWGNPTAASRKMLTVGTSGSLTLDELILDAEGRNGTLVYLAGGSLIANNCTFQNIVSTTAQNAVRLGDFNVVNGGTFVMNDGLITSINAADAVICFSGEVFLNGSATISNNKTTGITLLSSNGGRRPSLTMSGQTVVAYNERANAPGGGVFMDADVILGVNEGDAPSFAFNNSTEFAFGGIYMAEGTILTMNYGTEVSNNYGQNYAGGVGLLGGSTLNMLGNSSVKNNSSNDHSGGILITNSTVNIEDNATVENNTSVNYCGGIYVAQNGTLNIRGNARISGNSSEKGKGIYNLGTCNLSNSPVISDGLYFNSEDTIPVIVDGLTENADILIESSDYVAVENVTLAIAKKHADSPDLLENDRAAWRIPEEFGERYKVILNSELNQVLITLAEFKINYENLRGAAHKNPASYDSSELPITLLSPDPIEGCRFVGWLNKGQRITEIAEGTTGDLTLTAVWESLYVRFNGNALDVCNVPKEIKAAVGTIIIPSELPCRKCHTFLCWNIPSSSSGKVYFPGDVINVTDNLTLYAQWIKAR